MALSSGTLFASAQVPSLAPPRVWCPEFRVNILNICLQVKEIRNCLWTRSPFLSCWLLRQVRTHLPCSPSCRACLPERSGLQEPAGSEVWRIAPEWARFHLHCPVIESEALKRETGEVDNCNAHRSYLQETQVLVRVYTLQMGRANLASFGSLWSIRKVSS